MIPSQVYNIIIVCLSRCYKRRCVHTLVGYPHREGSGVWIESDLRMVNVNDMRSVVYCVLYRQGTDSETTFVSRVI